MAAAADVAGQVTLGIGVRGAREVARQIGVTRAAVDEAGLHGVSVQMHEIQL